MNNLEWYPVYYNGLETNLEVTKCGRVKRIRVDWMKRKTPIGEVDLNKLKHTFGYKNIGIQIKNDKQKKVQIQQLIASAFLDYKWNGNTLVVDHIDSNKENNNLENLRVITNRENCSKERTIKSGLPVGVSYWKRDNNYFSRIYINKKSIHLGYFKTIQEASNAYQNKLKEINN
jgi:hypothetical protein